MANHHRALAMSDLTNGSLKYVKEPPRALILSPWTINDPPNNHEPEVEIPGEDYPQLLRG